MKRDNPIIVALDYDTIEEAKEIVTRLGDAVDFYKVGSVLFTNAGPDLIAYLKEQGKRVFLDLKYHDIPNTVKKAVFQAVRMNVDLITIHLCGGKAMIKGALEGIALHNNPDCASKVIGVSVLTSIDQQMLGEEIKVELPIPAYIDHLVSQGLSLSLHGIVCSPQETKELRSKFGDDFLIVNPGIRCASDAAGDQKRIATPEKALADGASYLVIGRSITADADPYAKAMKIKEDIAEFL